MALQFRRAVRTAVKYKIGIDGPSGAGKTEGALALARGITDGGRVAVADTENASASYYADRYAFDAVDLPTSVTATDVREVIRLAVAEGYDALVIDSVSRVWTNILAAKDQYMLDNPKANSWTAWGLPQFGTAWEQLMKDLLDAPIHIIATMRSKQAHEQIEQGGRTRVVKLGLQPQVRDGAEYEFGLVFSVNMAHRAEATKDRTHLFAPNDLVDLCDPTLHANLRTWMTAETPATADQLAELDRLAQDAPEQVRAKIAAARPIGAAKAAKWIDQLRARADEANAATAKPIATATATKPQPGAVFEPATAAQIAEITLLTQHKAVSEDLVYRIGRALDEGTLSAFRADRWIAQLHSQIAEAEAEANATVEGT